MSEGAASVKGRENVGNGRVTRVRKSEVKKIRGRTNQESRETA